MKNLVLGSLKVTLHRTIRVHPRDKSHLPPSLGHLPLYKVSDYRENCPSAWEDDAVFVPLHEKEALWISTFSIEPVAVLIGAGGVNALTGEKLGLKLEKDNYLVTPPQPWLDGWKDQDGTVYQFVGTEYKKGEGLTVGEQLHGEECKTGGLGIAVFESKEPIHRSMPTPAEKSFGGAMMCASPESFGFSNNKRLSAEMGIGKGGNIEQKIYPDPYGIDIWKEKPSFAVAIYLINSENFSTITGLPMLPLPQAAETYYDNWYGLKDEHLEDVAGSEKFTGLKSVFNE